MSDAAGSTLTTSDGRQVVLGALVKSGGAGSVYRMRDTSTQVAKLYHPGADLRMYERKIAAMLELEPQLPELVQDGTRYVQLAWPDAALRDARGHFLGYLMPVVDIDATEELECVLQERQARRMGLPTGLGAKVTLAANLCAVIAALHRQRHYLVDLKPVNLRFYRKSLYMAMLDCDGFSIQGRGERFEAPQFTPDYLAPEFHVAGLTAAGEAQQDRFALAVVVFQLLNFGIHPFTGRPQSSQVPTDIPARIAGRYYAYGLRPSAALLPSPSSGHAAMPVELRTLFDRAFEGNGATRPSADEWSDLLRGYAQRAAGKLVACTRDPAHQHFAGQACAACERVQTLASAKAAAARRPPPTRIPPRPSPLARALAGKPIVVPTRAPGASRIPPAILAKINQAWAKRGTPGARPANWPASTLPASSAAPPPVLAPAPTRPMRPIQPMRRPANWPAPPAPPLLHQPPNTGRYIAERLIALGVFFLFFAVIFVVENFDNWRAQRRYEAEAPQRIAQARAQQQANRVAQQAAATARLSVPSPGGYEREQLTQQLEVLASAVVEGNDYAALRSLSTLRAQAHGRQDLWRRTLETARAGSVDTAAAPSPTAVVDAGLQQQRQGWDALARGDRTGAMKNFADALWFDSDAADAWLGYAVSAFSGRDGVGAATIALLMYPDAASARAARALHVPQAAHGDLARQREINDILDRAPSAAENLRTRFPRGMVRQTGPVAWGAQ